MGSNQNEDLYKVVGVMPDISKAVMIIGICLSVYWRIKLATDTDDYARHLEGAFNDEDYQHGGAENFEDLIEDSLSSSRYSYSPKVNHTTN